MGEVLPQAALAAWAASKAKLMSLSLERATSQMGLLVMGVMLVKYWPSTGATHFPPMKLSYRALKGLSTVIPLMVMLLMCFLR